MFFFKKSSTKDNKYYMSGVKNSVIVIQIIYRYR